MQAIAAGELHVPHAGAGGRKRAVERRLDHVGAQRPRARRDLRAAEDVHRRQENLGRRLAPARQPLLELVRLHAQPRAEPLLAAQNLRRPLERPRVYRWHAVPSGTYTCRRVLLQS